MFAFGMLTDTVKCEGLDRLLGVRGCLSRDTKQGTHSFAP
jgi:hypothetical protein